MSAETSPLLHAASDRAALKPSSLSDSLRDIIIGFSDGLTVPFALTAGLSSLGSSRLVIMGGLAELFSGMISMGLGAYLAAATERDSLRCRPDARARAPAPQPLPLAAAIAARYPALDPSVVHLFVHELCAAARPDAASLPLGQQLRDASLSQEPFCPERHEALLPLHAAPDAWLRSKLHLAPDSSHSPPPSHRPWLSGLTMGLSYFVGGLIPMLPYFIFPTVRDAFLLSLAITVAILLAFGYAKNYIAIHSHRAGLEGALQTLVIGVLAAGTSYGIVKLLDAGAS